MPDPLSFSVRLLLCFPRVTYLLLPVHVVRTLLKLSSNVVKKFLGSCYLVNEPIKKLVFVFRTFRLHFTDFFSGMIFTVVPHDLDHVTQVGA